MAAISIPCPACGALLKMPDTSLLGKRAKCPRCSHRFVLALPVEDEVALELVDVPVLPLAPKAGASARWVPDDLPNFSAPSVPTVPLMSADMFAPPANGPAFDIQVPGMVFPDGAVDSVSLTDPEKATVPGSKSAASSATAPKSRSAERLGTRKRRRGNKMPLIAMGILAVVVAGGGYAAFHFGQQPGPQVHQAPAVNEAWETQKVELAASNESAESLSPTSGKPIPLDYLPFTPHLLCHLHPQELWKKNDRTTVEFQATLGDLGLWLREQIRVRTRFEPEEIAELTFAVNFGARMSAPDIAAVVRLREAQTKTDLMKRFKGQRRPDPKVEVYDSEDFSFLLIDDRTFALAPVAMSEDLAMSRNDSALTSPDMEPLLRESDRDRHVSLVFDLKILDSHREDVFMAQLQKVVDKFVVWMGEEVETVSWSMHLDPNFYMETLLHNTSDSSVMKVQRHAQLQFSRLPEEMLAGVKKMKPATVGSREIIGRFPAMLQALDVGTTAHVAPACARLVTVLPRNASVNLAAGALLTWNQSLLTNFDDEVNVAKSDGPAVPDKIVDRLKMKVLVDFRRTPLQEAFGYIGESIKTEVVIDGDALKGAGFTQNMPQTFELGTVTAQAALHEIIKKYAQERDPLVLIVNESGKKLMLTTKVKAAADGLAVFDTSSK